jgi:ElaB/YqjD/DUF883 family membrane-anchored ribosome-binding protein
MAVEYTKFLKTYTGLKDDIADCTLAEEDKQFAKVDNASGQCGTGENFISEAVVVAVEEGYDKSNHAKLMTHPKVKQAIVDLNKQFDILEARIKDYDAWTGRMQDLQADLQDLSSKMAKDLKSRSKSSESRGDIETLKKKVDGHLKDVAEVLKVTDHIAFKRKYASNFNAAVTQALQNPVGLTKASMQKLEKHKYLELRNLNKARGSAMAQFKSIQASCTEALKTGSESPETAANHLKAARKTLGEVTSFVENYLAVFKKNAKDINESQDKDAILKVRDLMEKGVAGAKDLCDKVAKKLNID